MDSSVHRSIGHLINSLEQSSFWNILIGFLHQHINFDSWVALLLSENKPRVLSESDDDELEPFLSYINHLYKLDPFYLRSQNDPRNQWLKLEDVAPPDFYESEYFIKYFSLIATDELTLHVALGDRSVLSLSLGAKRKFLNAEIDAALAFEPWLIALIKRRMSHENPLLKAPAKLGSHEASFRSKFSDKITLREIEISLLIVRGYSNKDIARATGITAETAKVHRRNIFLKLGIKTQAELFTLFLS